MEETGESNCRGMNECRHRNERNYCNRAALSGTCETYGNASFKPGDFDLRSFNSVSATLKTEGQMQQFQKKCVSYFRATRGRGGPIHLYSTV